jgi:cellobiose-specific phosphotransferase system component IIB
MGEAIGRTSLAMAAFTDPAMALAFVKALEQREEYREVMENLELKSKRMKQRQDEVDVALCCPHLEYPAKTAVKEGRLHIPVFILPMRLYGQINIEGVIEEAEDVLELWNNGTPNPVVFPDEPRSMNAARNVSHRRWLAQQSK